jgi:hypothetical protein
VRKQCERPVGSVVLFVLISVITFQASGVAVGAAGATSTGAAQTDSSASEATTKEACLNCHGPFETLTAKTPDYVAPSGETIVPHRFVPHNSGASKAIPECNNCHEGHPLPPGGAARKAPPKADVQWCYTACHHENNFTPCKACHKEGR